MKDEFKAVQTSEISLLLNSYNDIFSDFDPRNYSVRSLSDDFLNEAKRATVDKSLKGIDLKFLVPHNKRSLHEEEIIKKRLKEYFKRHYDLVHEEIKTMVQQGLLFTLFGILLMFLAVFISFRENTIFTKFLFVLLEPGGWFCFWSGLDQVIFEPKTKKHELDFYKKMANSKINFLSY